MAGQHHGARRRGGELGEPPGDRLAQLEIHRVGLAVAHGRDGHLAAAADLDHAARTMPDAAGVAATESRVRAGHIRSAWITATVSTMIAMP